jgi:hypothetical protein
MHLTHTHTHVVLAHTHLFIAVTHTHTCACAHTNTRERILIHTRIIVNLTSTHIHIGKDTQAQLYLSFPLIHTHTHMSAHTHAFLSLSLCRLTTHTYTDTHTLDPTLPPTCTQVRGRGRRVGPRTTAHVLDICQIGALRQPGPHMLGPLVANLVVGQAGVRPPTQSVTHRDRERENEAT